MHSPLGHAVPDQWELLWTKSVYAIKAARSLRLGQLVSGIAGLNCLSMKKRMLLTLRGAHGSQLAFTIMPRSVQTFLLRSAGISDGVAWSVSYAMSWLALCKVGDRHVSHEHDTFTWLGLRKGHVHSSQVSAHQYAARGSVHFAVPWQYLAKECVASCLASGRLCARVILQDVGVLGLPLVVPVCFCEIGVVGILVHLKDNCALPTTGDCLPVFGLFAVNPAFLMTDFPLREGWGGQRVSQCRATGF